MYCPETRTNGQGQIGLYRGTGGNPMNAALPSQASASPGADTPLYVDLDGTLIRTDAAQELLIESLKTPSRWTGILRAARQDGRSGIKHALWDEAGFRPELLPYNDDVLSYLRQAREQGRRVILATAADRRVAEAVSAHLALFDGILASEPGNNLKGAAKLEVIRADAGGEPFEYLGDSRADIPIWEAAGWAGFVAPSGAVEEARRRSGDRVTLVSEGNGSLVRGLWKAMRPHQWSKNVLVFVPLLLSHQYGHAGMLLAALMAFVCVSILASSVYLANDLVDIEADRRHRTKRNRPFASGAVLPVEGAGAALGLATLALLLAFATLPPKFGAILLVYLAMTTAYSFVLKRFSTIDTIVLGMLYTLRIVAGAAACGIAVSSWLLTFSLFFFVSLAYLKRAIELERVEEATKLPSRNYWGAELSTVRAFGIANAAAAMLTLAQYMSSATASQTYGAADLLWLVLPLMMFWIYRTWMWACRGKIGDDPVIFAVTDRISQLTLATTVLLVVAARYLTMEPMIQ